MRDQTKERLVRVIKDLYFTTGEKWIDSHYKIGSVGEEGAWYYVLYYDGLEMYEDGIFCYLDLWDNVTSLEDITNQIVSFMERYERVQPK